MKNTSPPCEKNTSAVKRPAPMSRISRQPTPWRVRYVRLRNFKRINAMKSCKNEILLLRVFIRRVVDHANEMVTPEQQISMLRVISLACLALSRLVGTDYPNRDVRFDHLIRRMRPLSRQALSEARAFLTAFGMDTEVNSFTN